MDEVTGTPGDEAASAAASATSVQSLVRGLAVIRVFGSEHPRMTLSEVARRANLSRATARRVLHTLVALDYVGTDGRLFHLRPQILELGWAYLASLGLPDLAQPHLEALTGTVHESCSVAVLDDLDVVYVARVATQRIMTVAIHVGTRFPAHVTSMGRALLAGLDPAELDERLPRVRFTPLTPRTVTTPERLREELDVVRRRGWALVDQELELGLRSVAAPIRRRDGRVVAALNISAQANRSLEEIRSVLVPPLLATATAIERDVAAAGH